ncbi:LysR family transcriptional regulator [Pseudorhodoferax sp. Leaf265]|uniref:LysR family transcriptional regulator n=1 Tax=Pseudorhodoferax sp. Leaf265 TaxID=1736315 RepID=UPI000702389B|nr:LysR family transcriptional regulator [Pseudorhodoferax sp. Leaf265]KQP03667.1 transcriptional regulator [Pseudorhodoferax sp. Leaf265]PZP97987.1 MAG: LysR family transcriptional regulator [Variovorax paradoxus]PZQ09297.1 MAG: LysR family transcriptional regulator [Variovorax paradoxus]
MIEKSDQRLRMNLRQLEVFVATAHEGTTRGAADRIARSQSAASAALAELEAVLGAALFDRVGRRLLLNENGRALLPRARVLLEQAAELQELFSGAHAAPLHVAASFTIGEYLLPGLVAEWTRAHPHSRVRLRIANTSEVIDAVAGFAVDLGFIEGPQTHPDVVLRPWRSDELVIVAAPDHALAGRPATTRQLADATWVLREPESGTRQATDSWLLAHLDRLDVAFELGSTEAIKRLVAAGAGLGCLSRQAVAQTLAEGGLVELKTRLPVAERRLAVATHRHRPLGRTATDFIAHCTGAVA